MSAETLTACCAQAYAHPAARFLLGESLHPGSLGLTAELVDALALPPDALLVDVACGRGASLLWAGAARGLRSVGVDASPESVAVAREAAREGALDGYVTFLHGRAEELPVAEAEADGVLCECALCTFPDPAAALTEVARALRPGGRLALSDVTATPARLPPELRTLAARIACIAGARSLDETAAQVSAAGLAVERAERRDEALAELLEQLRARLRLARLAGPSLGVQPSLIGEGLAIVSAAQAALARGDLGYGWLLARRP